MVDVCMKDTNSHHVNSVLKQDFIVQCYTWYHYNSITLPGCNLLFSMNLPTVRRTNASVIGLELTRTFAKVSAISYC